MFTKGTFMDHERLREKIISSSTFRKNVYKLVPDRASRILDFGCGNGALSLRLQRDKGCSELFGLEVNPALTRGLESLIDGVFHINIEQGAQTLPEQYKGFFNYIILHDVVEHFYDPWFTLPKLRPFLAPEGKLIIATPNLQYWDFLYKILSGDFPYGPGLWHTGHLRWYTVRSLVELVSLSGFGVDEIFLEIPSDVNFERAKLMPQITTLELPPAEVKHEHPDLPQLAVKFPKDIKNSYPVFLAHKLIFVCPKGAGEDVEPVPTTYNCPRLTQMREVLNNPFDVYNPPRMTSVVGDWC